MKICLRLINKTVPQKSSFVMTCILTPNLRLYTLRAFSSIPVTAHTFQDHRTNRKNNKPFRQFRQFRSQCSKIEEKTGYQTSVGNCSKKIGRKKTIWIKPVDPDTPKYESSPSGDHFCSFEKESNFYLCHLIKCPSPSFQQQN